MKKYIVVTTKWEGFHYWKDAPEEVRFLRNLHRHLFHITVKWEVKDSDREKEFFIQKRKLEWHLSSTPRNIQQASCEMLAANILAVLEADFVSVFEDGENGAEVYK